MSDIMPLWTRQLPQVWEQLKETGTYTVKQEYIQQKNDTITDMYLSVYEWYTKKAANYIEIPKELKYPIWLSEDQSMMLQPTEGAIILQLEVPVEKVLVIDSKAWDYRVNNWYIPVDDEDERKFNKELRGYGIGNEADLTLTDKGRFYPLITRKIIASWERLFTRKPEQLTDGVATVWELKREWVKEIIF